MNLFSSLGPPLHRNAAQGKRTPNLGSQLEKIDESQTKDGGSSVQTWNLEDFQNGTMLVEEEKTEEEEEEGKEDELEDETIPAAEAQRSRPQVELERCKIHQPMRNAFVTAKSAPLPRRSSAMPESDQGPSTSVEKKTLKPRRATELASTSVRGLIGIRVNEYEITESLGSGSEAWVFAARDQKKHTKVALRFIRGIALKQLSPMGKNARRRTSLRAPTNLTSLRTELAILRKTDHPTIVKFIDVLDLQSYDTKVHGIAIIMELCPGSQLCSDEKLREFDAEFWGNRFHHRRQLFPVAKTISYFVQILSGLEYLHHNGIVHGDVKPSNILLDPTTDRIKLIDFGVSRLIDGSTAGTFGSAQRCHGGFGRGTLMFFSPESCKINNDETYCGEKADVWAASMCLYVMLLGHFPFGGRWDRETILKTLTSQDELFISNHHLLELIHARSSTTLLRKLLRKTEATRLCTISKIMQDKFLQSQKHRYLTCNGRLGKMQSIRDLITDHEVNKATTTVTHAASWEKLATSYSRATERVEALSRSMTRHAEHASEAFAEGREHFLTAAHRLSSESAEAIDGVVGKAKRISITGLSKIEHAFETVLHCTSPRSPSPRSSSPRSSSSGRGPKTHGFSFESEVESKSQPAVPKDTTKSN